VLRGRIAKLLPVENSEANKVAMYSEFLKNAEADEQKAATKMQTGKGTLPS